MTGSLAARPTSDQPAATNPTNLVQTLATGTTLIFAPHMDDAVLGCGGTIAQLPSKANVHVVYATDGTRSPVPDSLRNAKPSPQLRTIRSQEAIAALTSLEIPRKNIHFLDFPDGELNQHKNRFHQAVTDLLQQIQPTHVLIPFRYDCHTDHTAVSNIVTKAIEVTKATQTFNSIQIFEYFIYYRLQLLPKKDIRKYIRSEHLISVDIQQQATEKRNALNAFKTQTTKFYDWQQRPLLSAGLLSDVCNTPELFLSTNAINKQQPLFTQQGYLVSSATQIEPVLKKTKTRGILFFQELMNKHSASKSTRPRVCLLTESYYPIVGGGETQSRITAEDLVAEGFEVTIITRQSNASLAPYEEIGAIRVYRVPPQGKGHLKRWAMIKNVLPLLIKQRKTFDIILVSGYRALGIPATLVSLLCGKTCILKADNNGEMSGAFFAGGLKKWNLTLSSLPVRLVLFFRNGLFKSAQAFVSISSEIDDELKAAGIPPEKIHTIPNSVDISRFYPVESDTKAALRQKLKLPAEKKIVIFTGRLLATKGLPTLVEAWKSVQADHADAHLLIVGGGSKDIHDCETSLHDYVKEHDLTQSVQFTGDVNNVDEYLKASDIFVFPTEDEAFGISMIEAMACGLAAIATPVGGLRDIVTDRYNGLFVPAKDVRGFERAIAQLLEDPTFAKKLGAAAFHTVQTRYTRSAVAQQYIHLIDSL